MSYGLDLTQFRQLIVRPALAQMGAHSVAAENLLVGTALKESKLRYLQQINGPALGPFQMEPATHDDIWNNYLEWQPRYADVIRAMVRRPDASQLMCNLTYAAAMCRAHYLRVPERIPRFNDSARMAEYWKKYYNTEQGKGTAAGALIHFEEACK